MRQRIVAGNWKMNMGREAGMSLFDAVAKGVSESSQEGVEVILAPPFPFLGEMRNRKETGRSVHLAAQNCHQEDKGAFTGEVSARMLRSFGCEYVIVGHSERRQFCGETDALIRKKIAQLLQHGLLPIYCCGESLAERESEKHFDVVGDQVRVALQGFTNDQLQHVVLAYEPVWAIGTGRTATPAQTQEMHAFIRKRLSDIMGDEAGNIPILYGGSVKPDNAKELFAQKDIDGGLIGGASLNADDFLRLTRSF